MSKFNTAALQYHLQSKYFYNLDTLKSFLDYLNQIDSTGKVKFTVQVQDEVGLECLDLKLKFENGQIPVGFFAKSTNSFTYMLPTSC